MTLNLPPPIQTSPERERFVDINQCLGDSPFFRNSLAYLEGCVSDLESNIKGLLKLVKSSNEHAKGFFAF